ncbi:MAG TPA: hypothetical protein VJN18_04320 [Polyangiaceae bacterium]|nr:hypothetical protein [Polyangiaceae bacterium]
MMFLFLYRNSVDPSAQPSAAEMQDGYMQWKNWMGKYAKEILEQAPPKAGSKPGGAAAVVRKGAVTDGPYVEGKEIVGGWSAPAPSTSTKHKRTVILRAIRPGDRCACRDSVG